MWISETVQVESGFADRCVVCEPLDISKVQSAALGIT